MVKALNELRQREREGENGMCLLCSKNLSISSRNVISSLCWSLHVNAFNSSSSREWFNAESSELVLNRLELSSGDFDRNDIRSKPQFNSVESTLLLLSKSVMDWICCCGDNWIPTGFWWLFLFGGSGGGLLDLHTVNKQTKENFID